MKVLIAADWYLRLVVEGHALGLRDLGHEVRVLCRDHALEFGDDASERRAVLERLRSAGIPVIELPGRRYGPEGLPATMRAIRSLRSWGMEVLSAHENADPRLLLAGLGVPIVYTIHDPEPHPGEVKKKKLERLVAQMWLRASNRLVVHGPQLVDQLPERVRRRQSVSVVAHGIDVATAPAPIPAKPVVLLLGRLKAYKGVSVLVAAMREVWTERPDALLRVAGLGPAAREVPEEPRIELLEGYIPESEVPRLLRQARVVALPYTQASQSGVGLMSIAEGIPTVVTRTGALPELAVDEDYLAEPGDPASLARRIVAALDADMKERQRVLEFARERFAWRSVADDYIKVYEEVAEKSSRT